MEKKCKRPNKVVTNFMVWKGIGKVVHKRYTSDIITIYKNFKIKYTLT